MNERNNYHSQAPDEYTLQAPSSLLPQLLARLSLQETADTSLVSQGKALLHPEWTVRANAVQALAKLSDQESFELLHFALHDADDAVRACAVRVLGKRGDAADFSLIEQLEAALRDPTWHVRETAVYALGNIEAFGSIASLSEMLHDSDDAVRRAAAQVIEQLQSAERKEQQENVESGIIQSSQFSLVPVRRWPQWIRLSVAHLIPGSHAKSEKDLPVLEEKQDVADQNIPAIYAVEMPAEHVSVRLVRPRRTWLRVLEQAVAVLLVLGIAISWFAISRLPRSSGGAPTVFNDKNARTLGTPAYTLSGSLSYIEQWSKDGRTFFSLQVDTRKQALEVPALDATTGHTTTYPVLDSSWVAALRNSNIEQVGHYLIALRPHGNHQATMEIWDITGQHAITTQTIPATIAGNGQVESPYVVASNDEQKLALFLPGETVTIWNIARGQKLLTLDGPVPYARGIPPEIKWYNHDQNLLIFARNNFLGTLEAWNTTTGKLLINQTYTSRRFFEPGISPDGRYLAFAFAATTLNLSGSSNSKASIDILLILDAQSGHTLHTYMLNEVNAAGVIFHWLPDSQRLLIVYLPMNSTRTQIHIHIMNVFTGQTTFDAFSTYTGFYWLTQDSQYLLLGSLDSGNSDNSCSMQIWQTSSGRLIATITTPGIHPNPFSLFYANNRYLIIGEKETLDIWDIPTGKLLYKYHGFTPFSVAGNGGGSVFWSPDGKYLTMIAWKTPLVGSADGVIAIWRMP